MTERDYIDATNLAKIRSSKYILLDFLPMSKQDDEDMRAALDAMRRIEGRLVDATKITE